MGYISAASES